MKKEKVIASAVEEYPGWLSGPAAVVEKRQVKNYNFPWENRESLLCRTEQSQTPSNGLRALWQTAKYKTKNKKRNDKQSKTIFRFLCQLIKKKK